MPLSADTERTGIITLKGDPATLLGEGPSVGDSAPDFTVVARDMSEKKLSDYKGKTVILSVVPSLDTPTCDAQTRRFNQEAASLGDDVVVLTISMDLPPAMKRFCSTADIDNLEPLSDYKYHSFAEAFGLRIKEIGLLARALYVIDKDGKIVYEQIVPEIAEEPDYAPALEAAKNA